MDQAGMLIKYIRTSTSL